VRFLGVAQIATAPGVRNVGKAHPFTLAHADLGVAETERVDLYDDEPVFGSGPDSLCTRGCRDHRAFPIRSPACDSPGWEFKIQRARKGQAGRCSFTACTGLAGPHLSQ
jgi:hypothetical protein